MRLPASLVPPASIDRLHAVAQRLPGAVPHAFGFESRLAAGAVEADFACRLTRFGVQWLAGGTEWPRVAAFCDRLSRPDVSWTDSAVVWLEFDTRAAEGSEPCLLFGWDDPARTGGGEAGARSIDWVVGTALRTLRGSSASIEVDRQVARCLAWPVAHDRSVQIGVMLSRPIDAVRICIFGLDAATLASCLRDLEWPGDVAVVDRWLDRYASAAVSLGLHIDVGPSLFPTLGVDLLLGPPDVDPWTWQPDREPRWHTLFERLIEDGLCAAPKWDALRAWPARIPYEAPFVEQLFHAFDVDPHAHSCGVIVCGLNHLKLSLTPHRGEAAKAYFGVRVDRGAAA